MTWKIITAAFGLLLVIEGAVYVALPDVSRKLMAWMLESQPGVLRRMGIICVLVGLAILWLASSI